MAKHIYLYSYIGNYSIQALNEQIDQLDENEEIVVRLNSPGGEVLAGYSFLSRISEHKGPKKAIIDGQAKSMAAVWLPFFDTVTANDTSEIMFHKAAYPSWYEPTEKEQENLNRTNAKFESQIRKKVEGKVGAEKFLKELFAEDKRNDVELTPAQAKKLGLVTEIRTLTPTAYSGMQLVAMVEETEKVAEEENEIEEVIVNVKTDKMKIELTQEELNAKLAEARKEGAKAEYKRVCAWAVYMSIDPEAVKTGIKNQAAEVDAEIMAEMSLKQTANAKVEAHKDDNAPEVETPVEAKTEEELKKEATVKQMDELFK